MDAGGVREGLRGVHVANQETSSRSMVIRSRMLAITKVLVAHEGKDVRRVHPEHDVWHLSRPGLIARLRHARISSLEACRSELLRQLFAWDLPTFIYHPDTPADCEVPGHWHSQGDKTWTVPSGFTAENNATSSWLALGCWTAYVAREAVGSWPDIFRRSPDDIILWARTHGVRAAIVSSHDDDEWRVVLAAG